MPFADSLRALAGWNQTLVCWKRFIATEPEGCFLAEWEGVPVATAITLRYTAEVAWIGMVLVHPAHRRRGIGRALLNHCIAWLQERGAGCIKLDATPAGKRVYDRMGFKEEWPLTRWEHPGPHVAKPISAGLRPWQTSDAQRIGQLDAAAFGVSREKLLEALARECRRAFVLEAVPGRIAGYGFVQPGSRADYLGPIVATSAEAGIQVVEALLSAGGDTVFWDIPDANSAAVNWARLHGFTQQRRLTRMYLAEKPKWGDPKQQFALAGPEVG